MSQINLIIDSEDQNAVRASLAFFQTLAGEEVATLPGLKKDLDVSELEEKAKALAEKAKTEAATEKKTEPVKEPEKTAAPQPTISLNDLRQLVAAKAKTHKPEIREWLKGKGVSKTPELPEEHYPAYVEFLNSLA
jgi:thioredoxin reductase